jgi:hypothetical protein
MLPPSNPPPGSPWSSHCHRPDRTGTMCASRQRCAWVSVVVRGSALLCAGQRCCARVSLVVRGSPDPALRRPQVSRLASAFCLAYVFPWPVCHARRPNGPRTTGSETRAEHGPRTTGSETRAEHGPAPNIDLQDGPVWQILPIVRLLPIATLVVLVPLAAVR